MTHITLAHGNGGHYMRQLIEDVFAKTLDNPILNANSDAVTLPALDGELMMSVDGFTVQPLEFPGGDIGSLAIHGTVNDLAVSGAKAKYLSLSVLIEEGLEVSTLQRLIQSMATAAKASGVVITCGDTKVVPKGEGSGLYLTTTGIGVRNPALALDMNQIQDGDHILISGSIGDHGTAIMLAREQFGLKGDIRSDADCVLPLCETLYGLDGLRFMRDPTRGGLATVLYEINHATGLGVRVGQTAIPIKEQVIAVCEMLGYDPLYLACEGRVLAVVASDVVEEALRRWQAMPQGCAANDIGQLTSQHNRVILETELGGERILQELEDDPLPRIC